MLAVVPIPLIWRTENIELLRSIATQPRVWARIASDGLMAEDYEPVIHPRVHYLTDGRGFFSWRPMSTVCYEGHIVHLGPGADEFAKAATAWMLERGAESLVVLCPSHNWNAKKMAQRCGFQQQCSLTNAVEWRGRLHDLWVMEYAHGSSR